MAMIGPLEFQDFRPAGGGPGQPQGAHHRLGAGGDEPDLLDRRDCLGDLLGQRRLRRGRRAEGRPLLQRLVDGFPYFGRPVP